jgi:hypothetical protein
LLGFDLLQFLLLQERALHRRIDRGDFHGLGLGQTAHTARQQHVRIEQRAKLLQARGGGVDLLRGPVTALGQLTAMARGHLRRRELAVGGVLEMEQDIARRLREEGRRQKNFLGLEVLEHRVVGAVGRKESAVSEIGP